MTARLRRATLNLKVSTTSKLHAHLTILLEWLPLTLRRKGQEELAYRVRQILRPNIGRGVVKKMSKRFETRVEGEALFEKLLTKKIRLGYILDSNTTESPELAPADTDDLPTGEALALLKGKKAAGQAYLKLVSQRKDDAEW